MKHTVYANYDSDMSMLNLCNKNCMELRANQDTRAHIYRALELPSDGTTMGIVREIIKNIPINVDNSLGDLIVAGIYTD